MLRTTLLGVLFSACLSPLLHAQNNADTCNQAPLVGDGVWPFDTTGASPSGVQPDAGMCEDFGQSDPRDMHNDVWFEWVPGQSGDYRLSTCNDANYDSKLALYDGSCASLQALACDDDGPGCSGFTSQLDIGNISAGATYFIQVGGFSASETGTGNLTIEAIAGPTVGPDIAVSGVGNNDFINYGSSGGIRAYSFATTSCNVGDQEVNWFSGIGNDHPLIGQNLFRIDSGRIEQLGYSFLKHGFCAVNENSCGSCQGTPCATLGLGCADTYSANLNDGDDGASKRSVNATDGTYVGNPGPVGDPPTINGRLQVVDSELTGTLIAESQYVSEHDHGAGLARNNASWRQVSASGNGNLSGVGAVQMFDPGIFAWRDLAGAEVVEVVNTDEGGSGVHGYFFVGYQVTDLGGGQWRYEYAVQNFNSDRSGRAFQLPLASGVSISSVYFRDVLHHSGDPYSNQDWSFSQSGGVLRWESEDFATNADANALRWGTLYNFGFTANAAPELVSGSIELFKPGIPTALTFLLEAPGGAGLTDCNNNGIDDAQDIADGTSLDCDNNGVPDECQADCDNDGIPDVCEVDCNGNGTPDECETIADCNGNGIPDECEPDCDGDGTPDDCETDCNSNGTPDDCERGPDCNANGIPDDCEPDCDGDGIPDDCEIDCNANGIPDECEQFTDCNGNGVPDECDPDCDGDGLPDDCEEDCNGNGIPDDCEQSTDCNGNGVPDECEPDCDGDGIPDDCEADCNGNGTPDDCETFTDCNGNGIPDECEPDCDGDGIPDACESDCNGNGIPDDCEQTADCNGNGIPDECEPDCDGDGVPDDCEADCNANGVPDDCESFTDCNGNGIPDECEPDCDGDGIPDDCEADCDGNGLPDDCEAQPDCNGNGVPDICDLAAGGADCNGNGQLDECDLASGKSMDANGNGVPDECEVDCNQNGVPDDVDISSGTSQDSNGNGIPDECELLGSDYGFCVSGPCGNDDPSAGCENSTGSGALLTASGTSSVSADDMALHMGPIPLLNFGIFFMGLDSPGSGITFGDGLRHVSGTLHRFPVVGAGMRGSISFGPIVSHSVANFRVSGHILAGSSWNFQGWYRDPLSLCGSGFNLTQAMNVLFLP